MRNNENDEEFIQSINLLLNEKKWMGPNLYKLLRKYKWKGYEIDTLADLMEESIEKEAKFNTDKTRNLINRTLANIKAYSQYVKQHPNATGSFRLISTISDWPSSIFSIEDIANDLAIEHGRETTRFPRQASKTDIVEEFED